MSIKEIDVVIDKYKKLKAEELKRSFPFDFGVIESMQKMDDYDMFINDLLWLQRFYDES